MNKLTKAEQVMKYYEGLGPEGRERYICSLDPFYYLTRYVKTYDPYEGIRSFPSFGYLEATIHALQDARLNIFRKGRQLTFSWTFSAYGLWESQFQFAATSLYTSKRQEDSFELKDRAFFMWDNLPPWLRFNITEDNKSTMGFRQNMSKLKFLPATDNVGRTFTAGHIYMDEFAHVTCNAAKMYTSIKPTINSGGRCTVFSSPNGPYGKFYDLCGGDESPESGWSVKLANGFNYHFMPYDVHPEHDSEWEKEAFTGMTLEEIDQEYRALWIKRGGRVYPLFDIKTHIVEPFPIPDEWLKVRAIDFGAANPTACIWMAFDPQGRAYIYREYKQQSRPIKDHAEFIKDSTKERIQLGTISDHESQTRIEYEEHGVTTQPAIKDWDSGRNEVMRHLMADAKGEPGLFVFSDCKATVAEFMVYSYPEVDRSKRDAPEKPLQMNDHLMDAIRYALRTTKGRRKGFTPFREMGGKSQMSRMSEGYRSHRPVERINALLVPRFGISLDELHSTTGSKPIQRLGL